MTTKEELIKRFNQNNGYLYTRQMKGSAFRYHLNQMLENGEVVKIRHGLYLLASDERADERALVSALIPQGVFCLFSAWFYYELTTTVPYQHHIALHRNTSVTLPPYPPITLYRWQDKYIDLGVVNINEQGQSYRYYDMEKSVCDAVKFRNKVGDEITYEVLKNYMRSSGRQIEKLMSYAHIMRIENIITPMLKPLL